MSRDIQGLRAELSQIRRALQEGSLLAHAPELKRSLTLGVDEMLDKADRQVEENLVVGLIGGTGVGKSTLMNALAGRPIASASHRRPHTDQVLVYRHEATTLPSNVGPGAPLLREITHDAEAIAQIVLCDLPDFDSVVPDHRRGVLDFMEHLDLLVWVVTPEKYADGGLYTLLAEVPKAGRNFIFVLNKSDLLFESVPPDEGYDRLARVSGLFARHLVSNGIDSPIVHCISAARVVEGAAAAPWNQFPLFRELLFQRRELKEISAIKSANLDVEKGQLLRSLDAEIMRVRTLVEALDRFVGEVERARSEWVHAGQRHLRRWVRALPLERMAGRENQGSPALAGPGLLIAAVARRLEPQDPCEWHAAVEEGCSEANRPLAGLRRELERLEDRMVHGVLQAGLPQTLVGEVRAALAFEDRWQRWTRGLEEKAEGLAAFSFAVPRKGFRWLQRVVHGFVFLLFVVALVRLDLILGLIQSPSGAALLSVVVSLLLGIFQASGVAALGSLLVLQLFLGWRFYGRHKKWLQQRSRRFIETLEQELTRLWEMELDDMVAACRNLVAARQAAIEEFEVLRGAGRDR